MNWPRVYNMKSAGTKGTLLTRAIAEQEEPLWSVQKKEENLKTEQ